MLQNLLGLSLIWVYIFEGIGMFGISMTLCGCFVATPFLFDVAVCGTAFGYCNLAGRCMMILAPIISELPQPLPLAIFGGMTFTCLVCSFCIQTPDDGGKGEGSKA